MQLNFEIRSRNLHDFIEHWSARYSYNAEWKYNGNIGQPLTEESRQLLFEWKNDTGKRIAEAKQNSIRSNYPLQPPEDLENRYLSHNQPGGAIWNIFYLHCGASCETRKSGRLSRCK